MELRDSRRLTGPNLLWSRPGAVIDVAYEPGERARVIAWRDRARALLEAVGWQSEELATRIGPRGASLAISAPIDALYAACSLNEAAWAQVCEGAEPDIDALREEIDAERSLALIALQCAAAEHDVAFLSDDDVASVGYGTGSRSWPVGDLPGEVDWSEVHDVPVVLVTGTNGKSTTVRLVAAMAAAAGRVPGVCSTDGIRVGDELVDSGDYSGPGGARQVLRHPRTEIAILETARGGMLRRGLGVRYADAAVILNVAADHLGEWGVEDVEALCEAKFIVQRAVEADGALILNADDELVANRGRLGPGDRIWFSLDAAHPIVTAHAANGGTACVLRGDELTLIRGDSSECIAVVGEVSITLDGKARFNVHNALAAIAAATAIDLPIDAIRAGLRAFDSTPDANPGRGNRFDLGGVSAWVDFAHNPHGVRAVMEMASAMPAKRRLVTLGQAGDRTHQEILDLVDAAWTTEPDRVVLKEMTEYLRGREPGVVVEMMARRLEELGAPAEHVVTTGCELSAARHALEWARPGDLLLLLVQAQRTEVLELCQRLAASGWRPGDPL